MLASSFAKIVCQNFQLSNFPGKFSKEFKGKPKFEAFFFSIKATPTIPSAKRSDCSSDKLEYLTKLSKLCVKILNNK